MSFRTTTRYALLSLTSVVIAGTAAPVYSQFTEPKIIPAEVIIEETESIESAESETVPQLQTQAVSPEGDKLPAATQAAAITPIGVDARSLMKSAFERTKTATDIEGYGEVIHYCEQALAAGPDDKGIAYTQKLLAWSHNRRGKLYAEQASSTENAAAATLEAKALADFEAAVKYDSTKWQAVHNRGVSYAQADRFDEAIADFTKTIELNRTYVNAWYNRGEIYYQQGELEKALADYTEVIRLDSEDAGAYTSRGHANYELGKYRDAINDYNKAVQYDRTNATAVTNRADLYSNLGIWDRAARDYRTAVQMNPALGRAYLGAAWLMATCPEDGYRDAKLAVISAEKAIQLDGSDDYRYLDTLAAAYANIGDWDKAKTTLQQAIEKAPVERQASLKTRLQSYTQNQPYRDPARTAMKEGETITE